MQSSARNALNVRLKTATHSPRREPLAALRDPADLRRLGSTRSAVAAACRGEEAHRRADAAGEEEACTERARRRPTGSFAAQLARRRSLRRRARPQLLDRLREPLALRLDLAADRLGRAPLRLVVAIRLQRLGVSFASRIACSGTGGVPCLTARAPSSAEDADESEQPHRHEQQREPGVDDERERGGDRREHEAEREEGEEPGADARGRAGAERSRPCASARGWRARPRALRARSRARRPASPRRRRRRVAGV